MKYPDQATEDIVVNQLYTADAGDVECPTGWFCIAGKKIIQEDNLGFIHLSEYDTESEAQTVYASLDSEFSTWAVEPYPEGEETFIKVKGS